MLWQGLWWRGWWQRSEHGCDGRQRVWHVQGVVSHQIWGGRHGRVSWVRTRVWRAHQMTELVACRWHGIILGLASRTIFVVGILLHMLRPNPLCLVYKWFLLLFREQFPLFAQPLWDLWIVHFRVFTCNCFSLNPCPDHKRVHRPLDVTLHICCLKPKWPARRGTGVLYRYVISTGVPKVTHTSCARLYSRRRWRKLSHSTL